MCTVNVCNFMMRQVFYCSDFTKYLHRRKMNTETAFSHWVQPALALIRIHFQQLNFCWFDSHRWILYVTALYTYSLLYVLGNSFITLSPKCQATPLMNGSLLLPGHNQYKSFHYQSLFFFDFESYHLCVWIILSSWIALRGMVILQLVDDNNTMCVCLCVSVCWPACTVWVGLALSMAIGTHTYIHTMYIPF